MTEVTSIRKPSEFVEQEHPATGSVGVGSFLLGSGTFLLSCALMDTNSTFDFPLPAIWSANLPMWSFLGILGILSGAYLLKQSGAPEKPERFSPEQPVFQRLIVYTRPGCHLCEIAIQELQEYENILPDIEEIDISGDPQLELLYGTTIPVVEIDGRVRFRARINPVLLKRMIEGELSKPVPPNLHQLQFFAPRPGQ